MELYGLKHDLYLITIITLVVGFVHDVTFAYNMDYSTRPTHYFFPRIDQQHTYCMHAHHVQTWPKVELFLIVSFSLSTASKSHNPETFHSTTGSLKRHKAYTLCIQNASLHVTLQSLHTLPNFPSNSSFTLKSISLHQKRHI